MLNRRFIVLLVSNTEVVYFCRLCKKHFVGSPQDIEMGKPEVKKSIVSL